MLSLALVLVVDRTPAPLDSSLGSCVPPGSALEFVDLSGRSFACES